MFYLLGYSTSIEKIRAQIWQPTRNRLSNGGLLPHWHNYNRHGISQPNQVAEHWNEVETQYQMPISGEIWKSNPLPSSYPPSIAFKAAQLQHPDKAIIFLRKIREALFVAQRISLIRNFCIE